MTVGQCVGQLDRDADHGVHVGPARPGRFRPQSILRTAVQVTQDVEHDPGNLRAMVYWAEVGGFDLVSLMVMLHCETRWEKFLIPAFVYFFQMLYPFPRINDPRSNVAGAAGGCMLVRAESLRRAGGIESIRGEIIDDCALGYERSTHEIGRALLAHVAHLGVDVRHLGEQIGIIERAVAPLDDVRGLRGA